VDIEVNEVPVNIHMKLDDNGAAYFVEVVDTDDEEEELPPSEILYTFISLLNSVMPFDKVIKVKRTKHF
jgi:hypothetical protein